MTNRAVGDELPRLTAVCVGAHVAALARERGGRGERWRGPAVKGEIGQGSGRWGVSEQGRAAGGAQTVRPRTANGGQRNVLSLGSPSTCSDLT